LLLVVVWAPTWVVEQFLIPTGLVAPAYYLSLWLRPLGFVQQPRAGAVLFGARALATHGRAAPQHAYWLRRRLCARERGSTLVAGGLLAGLLGQQQRAKSLLTAADRLSGARLALPARALARDYLVAEAAQRGAFPRVVRLGLGEPRTAWSYAVARMGERLLAIPGALSNEELRSLWQAAPHRQATADLLARAQSIPRRELVATATDRPKREKSHALPRALGLTAFALAQPEPRSSRSIERAALRLTRALELPAFRARVARRCLGLCSTRSPALVVQQFREQLVELLAICLASSAFEAPSSQASPLLARAIHDASDRLFRDLQARCSDYRERTRTRHDLLENREEKLWQTFIETAARLRSLDPEREAEIFHCAYEPLVNFAVAQHSWLGRRLFSRGIYLWLAAHAGSDPERKDNLYLRLGRM
jgi:hypothetical protein